MHHLLETMPQWAAIIGMFACIAVFVGVLLQQLGDRRTWYADKMSAMPLHDGSMGEYGQDDVGESDVGESDVGKSDVGESSMTKSDLNQSNLEKADLKKDGDI